MPLELEGIVEEHPTKKMLKPKERHPDVLAVIAAVREAGRTVKRRENTDPKSNLWDPSDENGGFIKATFESAKEATSRGNSIRAENYVAVVRENVVYASMDEEFDYELEEDE